MFIATETLSSLPKLSVTGEHLELISGLFMKGISSRQYAFAKPKQKQLTLDYCSIELKVTAAYAAAVAGTIGFGLTGLLIFLPNAFQLPMKFYIFFLPIGSALMNWALNYAFQLIFEFFAVIFFLGYFCMSIILVNHSCWVFESAGLSVHELDETLTAKKVDHHKVLT